MRGIAKKGLLIISLLITIFLSLALLCGCQSTDMSESYMDTSYISNAQLDYDSDIDRTKVIWYTTISNNTIYNLTSFSVTVRVESKDGVIQTHTYNYTKDIKHGKDYTGYFTFQENGEIVSIKLIDWCPKFSSFWNTYKIWCIVILSLAGVASIAYIVYMIVEDVELGDTVDAVVDFFEEHAWVAVSFIIPLGGIIWGAVTSNWILILLVLGGFIAFISIALLAHLIKYVFENFIFGFSNDSNRRDESDVEDEMLNAEFEDVEDCVDDRNKLETFTVAALKEYCRKHNIRGYYKLNKSKIINLIVSSSKVDSADSGNYEVQKNSNLNLSDSRITFEDIAGLEEAKTAFREKVVFALEHKDLYEKYGKKVGGGLLLYGLPGTGKTMFAEAASNETNALFIPIKCSDIKSKWYGESENNVKEIFAKARKTKKAIIFFDEFEAIGAKRTDNSDNVNNDLVPQILAEMQGIGTNNSDNIIIVIAATNKPWAIDSAFMRPGRFDDKIYIPLPDFAARKRLFELKLNGIPQENLDYEYLAKISDGFNGADVGAFCEKLKMIAIKQSIALNNEYLITMEDIKTVEGKIMSSVSKEDIERLIEFSKR